MTADHLAQVAAVADLVAEASGLEAIVDATLAGLDEVFGFQHLLLLLHEEGSDRLVTLASRGYEEGGIGSEVRLGDGVIGMAAARRRPMRITNLQRMLIYARSMQAAASASPVPGTDIGLPGLPDARSQVAVPMVARGELVGVLAAESTSALAFEERDELALAAVGHLVGAAIEREHCIGAEPEDAGPAVEPPPRSAAAPSDGSAVRIRHYALDGSTFVDDAYLIKGVAGRLLWKVASEHVAEGRRDFTNREARLDPALDLPPYRDNFESRLILLKRRLEERAAPLRIVSTGRGRFRLEVGKPIELERVGDA